MRKTRARPQPPFPDAITLAEAAGIVGKTRAALQHAVKVGALPVTRDGTHVRATMWVSLTDLRRAYPPERHGSQKHRIFRLTPTQERAVLGFERGRMQVENGIVVSETRLPRPREIEGIGPSRDMGETE